MRKQIKYIIINSKGDDFMLSNRKLSLLLIILFPLLLASLCIIQDFKNMGKYIKHEYDPSYYNETIDTKIPTDSTVLMYKDNYGGFPMDGNSYAIIQLTQKGRKSFIKSTDKNDKWHSLPIKKDFQKAIGVFDYDDEDSFGPDISKIKNGIYYFRDRYAENYPEESKTNINDRYAYNFTVAIFDFDTNKLHIYTVDT